MHAYDAQVYGIGIIYFVSLQMKKAILRPKCLASLSKFTTCFGLKIPLPISYPDLENVMNNSL